MLYRVALVTGLRRGELAALRIGDIDLDSGVVHVQAAYAKNRRRDLVPLHSELIAKLRAHLEGRAADELAFKVPSRHKSAPMLRADLEDAGLRAVDDQGRLIDFHGLRTTFVSDLVRTGAHPKTAQLLARHSTIRLVMDAYARVPDASLREAIERLSA